MSPLKTMLLPVASQVTAVGTVTTRLTPSTRSFQVSWVRAEQIAEPPSGRSTLSIQAT